MGYHPRCGYHIDPSSHVSYCCIRDTCRGRKTHRPRPSRSHQRDRSKQAVVFYNSAQPARTAGNKHHAEVPRQQQRFTTVTTVTCRPPAGPYPFSLSTAPFIQSAPGKLQPPSSSALASRFSSACMTEPVANQIMHVNKTSH